MESTISDIELRMEGCKRIWKVLWLGVTVDILLVVIVNASARPPRLAGLPNVGTCNYRYTGI